MRALQRGGGVGCHGDGLGSWGRLGHGSLVELLEALFLLLAVDLFEPFRFSVDFFLPFSLFFFEHPLDAFGFGVLGTSAVRLFDFDLFAQAGGFVVEFPLGEGVCRWRAAGARRWRSGVGG